MLSAINFRSMADRCMLIFGAGKIGRSFIGQLFGRAGYSIVFVERDEYLVKLLNLRNSYPVIIKGPDGTERMVIGNVRAIHSLDRDAVQEAVVAAEIIAISVGKNALPSVAQNLAPGIMKRVQQREGAAVDVILAENMRSADLFFREKLRELLPPGFPLEEQVGLVETSIGKMVPIMTAGELEKDPLAVFAEPYNTLILNKLGFRGKIPDVEGLSLKENMKAWVDRKAFIHNLGHASAAYCGYLRSPQSTFMYQVLEDPLVSHFTKKVMLESSRLLVAAYPDEFTMETLEEHIDDLLSRFRNRNLRDTLFRVGCDLTRKLGADDRFMGAIRMALHFNEPYGTILDSMAMGFFFKARDEAGRMWPQDVDFHRSLEEDPLRLLQRVCGLDPGSDATLIGMIKQKLMEIKGGTCPCQEP